jgi:hypothetical protein
VRRVFVSTISIAASFALFVSSSRAEGTQQSREKFVYRDATGRVASVKVIRHYW